MYCQKNEKNGSTHFLHLLVFQMCGFLKIVISCCEKQMYFVKFLVFCTKSSKSLTSTNSHRNSIFGVFPFQTLSTGHEIPLRSFPVPNTEKQRETKPKTFFKSEIPKIPKFLKMYPHNFCARVFLFVCRVVLGLFYCCKSFNKSMFLINSSISMLIMGSFECFY